MVFKDGGGFRAAMRLPITGRIRRGYTGLSTALVALAALVASPAAANSTLEERAAGIVAILGLAAVPNQTTSSLSFDARAGSGDNYDFRSGQFGGGFTWSENLPIHLEGYVGYVRYDPALFFSFGEDEAAPGADEKWTGITATGGIGWDFRLADNLVFRPILHVTLGEVTRDAGFLGDLIDRPSEAVTTPNLSGLGFEDGLTAAGFGGAVMLAYDNHLSDGSRVEISLRHNHIRIVPVSDIDRLDVQADSISTTLWSRLRVPTPLTALDRPVRAVGEFSASWLSGDLGRILAADWLTRAGVGAELNLEETRLPWFRTARVMLRATRGSGADSWSLGFALGF